MDHALVVYMWQGVGMQAAGLIIGGKGIEAAAASVEAIFFEAKPTSS